MSEGQPAAATSEPHRHIGHLIRRAQQAHAALWAREVSAEVSSVQYGALSVLARRPGISQRELGEELSLDRSTIAELVPRMAAAGLLVRERDAVDRRQYVLALTGQGRTEHARLLPRVERVQELLLAPFAPDEAATLRGLLARLPGADG